MTKLSSYLRNIPEKRCTEQRVACEHRFKSISNQFVFGDFILINSEIEFSKTKL